MKRSWFGVLGVVLVAGGTVAYKQRRVVPPIAPSVEASSVPSVLLFADPREAEEACGCGQIIRLVRAASARGVAIREVPPGESDLTKKYQVTVEPTVLFVDSGGRVTARHEGEASQTIEAIRTGLNRLSGARQ